jgi:diguanylate cyclase (GGDEF)-like protein
MLKIANSSTGAVFWPILARKARQCLTFALSALAILIGCVVFEVPVHALPADRSISEFIHRSWSVDEGLPHSTVRAIAQTADGYIWFGTPEGVSRFDGVRFDGFESALFAPIRGAGVASLLATRDGGLIIGTRGQGIWRYEKDKLVRLAPTMLSTAGGSAIEAPNGDVWISLDTDGLARISGDKVRTFTLVDGLPSNAVRALQLDQHGVLWIGTLRGLATLREDRIELPLAGTVWATVPVAGLSPRKAGGFWLGMANKGVASFDKGVLTPVGPRNAFQDANITSIHADRDETIWVGAVEGLFRIAGGKIERTTTAEGLSSNTVRALFEDAEGGMWAGTDRGVNRYRSGAIRAIGARHGLEEEFVRAVMEDRKGRTWIATSDGLYLQRPDRGYKRYAREHGLVNNAILSMAEDASGTLWAGSYGGGLHKLAGDRFVPIAQELQRAATTVRAIVPGRDRELWIGTSTGLYLVDAGSGRVQTHWDVTSGLPSEHVNALYLDGARRLWIGTRAGLAMRDGGGQLHVIPQIGAGSNVLSLSAGNEQRLWVSTARGLALLQLSADTYRVSPVTDRSALPEQSFFAVVEDGRGSIWICANRGLIRAPVEAMVKPAKVSPGEGIGVQLGRGDGMPTAQCNGATQPSGWKTTSGQLLFATARGLAAVHAGNMQIAVARPPVPLIKSVHVDGAPVPAAARAPLRLAAGSHRVEIEFIGISLAAPERLRYEYRLLGLDDNWMDAKSDTKAVFANLPSGTYRFEVRSHLGTGEASASAVHLEVVQEPRLVERWWFRVLMASALIAMIVAVIALRVRHLEAQKLLLHKTVEARTSELETEKRKLQSISEEREQLLNQVAESARAYEKLSKEDSLTGIANRRELDRVLSAEFARSVRTNRPLSVILADIDHFKRVNDEHSHAVGDAVLKHVAQVLKHACRKIDSVGRFGGEEFLLVLPETGHDEAMHICERLRKSIAGEDPVSGPRKDKTLPAITMSFGVASLTDETTHERLIAHADAKLYEAKHAGRNRVMG